MSHTENRRPETCDRRGFLKTGMVSAVGTAVAGTGIVAAEPSVVDKTIATRTFGKTGCELPILAYGGAGLPKLWGNPLSTEDRVKLVRYAYDRGVRYYDTAGNYMESEPILGEALKGIRDKVYLVSKVETTKVEEVRRAVENSLRKLQTDYLDGILIHGTPGIEQMSVKQAMKIHGELVKLRDERVVRFIGLSAHSYYDKALALISSGGFDQCMLSYGYVPRGHNQTYSAEMLELRKTCLDKAHELGMGIVAMKVVGAGMLGAWSKLIVPGFERARIEQLPAAAIRYALKDKRVHMLCIGMRLTREIDANIKTLASDTEYTENDRSLLTEFCAKLMESAPIKSMRID